MPSRVTLLILALILGAMALACERLDGVLTPAPADPVQATQTPYPTYTVYPTYTPYPFPTVAAPPDSTPAAITPAPTVLPTPDLATPVPPAPSPTQAATPVTVIAYYQDQDGDGFGSPANPLLSDFPAPGYVTNSGDCDDTDDEIHPNSLEVLDGKDNDCDGQVDEDLASAVHYLDSD